MQRQISNKNIELKKVMVSYEGSLKSSDLMGGSYPYKKSPEDCMDYCYEGREILDACDEKGYFNLGPYREDNTKEFRGKISCLEYRRDLPGCREFNPTVLSFQEFLEVGKKVVLFKKIIEVFE